MDLTALRLIRLLHFDRLKTTLDSLSILVLEHPSKQSSRSSFHVNIVFGRWRMIEWSLRHNKGKAGFMHWFGYVYLVHISHDGPVKLKLLCHKVRGTRVARWRFISCYYIRLQTLCIRWISQTILKGTVDYPLVEQERDGIINWRAFFLFRIQNRIRLSTFNSSFCYRHSTYMLKWTIT